jgi:NTE family protein
MELGRPGLKTALVLSAGAFLGAYQAGVWKELSRRFRPDLVAGSSVGALNGWAVAGGCNPDDLIAQWLDRRTSRLLRFHLPLLPWNGVFDPAPLVATVREMYDAYHPQVPYAATLVELPYLRLRYVRTPDVQWEHLLAACSFLTGYPPVRVAGRYLSDGGLLSVVPLDAAAALGATRAIVVHAMPVMPSRLVRMAVRTTRALARPPAQNGPPLEIRTISPSVPARRLRELIRWDRDRIVRLIEMGQQDARASKLFDG